MLNTSDLIDKIAREASCPKAVAKRAVESLAAHVHGSLRKGNAARIQGLGTFATSKRAARTGRNPRTGEPLKIKAKRVPVFRPAQALKDAADR